MNRATANRTAVALVLTLAGVFVCQGVTRALPTMAEYGIAKVDKATEVTISGNLIVTEPFGKSERPEIVVKLQIGRQEHKLLVSSLKETGKGSYAFTLTINFGQYLNDTDAKPIDARLTFWTSVDGRFNDLREAARRRK